MPPDSSWLAFALWLVGIGVVAALWHAVEEWLVKRRCECPECTGARRKRNADQRVSN